MLSGDVTNEVPSDFSLSQNYPNPFNPSTTIKFNIPKSGNVKITIYDIAGKKLADVLDRDIAAGSYSFKFDMGFLSSGVYFYRMVSGNFTDTKRMTIVK